MSYEPSEKLKGLIALLPEKPGCYLMKDSSGKIIYIGKAKNLKKRVSQYFLRPQQGKVAAMVSHVDSFDFIVVHTDKESFILEMNLIKSHYPRYNIMLMDDSHYPYIAVKRNDAFLKISRSNSDRRYFHFGPFPNSGAAYKTINLLNSLYPTRKCRDIPSKPCLYYHMGQCLAPCINKISDETYENLYNSIKRFLDGDIEDAAKKLTEKMEKASSEERYEDAASYKATLDAIKSTVSKQAVELNNDKTDRDVFSYASREGYFSLSVLTYRRGMLLGKNVFVVPSFGEEESQAAELIEYYYNDHDMPSEILSSIGGLESELSSIFPELKVHVPKEGRLLSLVDLAALNAREGLDAHFMSARLSDDNLALLESLGKLLHIETPYRIELFDNSHLEGSDAVGAMVCFINGERAKGMYRKFLLDKENAGDDYHSMKEVVYRRYKRLKEEGASYPDIILADGGLTQVHASIEALEKAEVSIPVYGLFKNDRHETEGIIDKDGNVYPLSNKSPLFFLLMRMQDEVHRYAISFHKDKRSKSMGKSLFDDIEGIGPKRKEMLRKHYPSLDLLKGASENELKQLLPDDVAAKLFERIKEL